VVSGTPADKKDKLDSYITASMPAEARNMCDIYFLPGKLIIKELSLLDRMMIKIGARLDKRTGAKKEMIRDYNGVKKENIVELLNALKKFSIVKSENLQKEPVG
jgi:hypothetical protein